MWAEREEKPVQDLLRVWSLALTEREEKPVQGSSLSLSFSLFLSLSRGHCEREGARQIYLYGARAFVSELVTREIKKEPVQDLRVGGGGRGAGRQGRRGIGFLRSGPSYG